jgi:RNA 3'-terminal phosphate cyclase (ATP)
MEKVESDLETSLVNEDCELEESEAVQSQKVQLNENGELVISVKPVYDDNGFLIIDGSQGEGGGQVIRMALAFSCIFGKPVHLTNIRANRNNPGLGKQHLAIVQLLKTMYQATASSFEEGTTEIIFVPGQRSNLTSFECDTGTASSITLMMQALLPCLLFGHLTTTIDFRGGTNGTKSPSIEYFTNVIEPILKKFGAKFTLDLKKKSYVPSGGAQVTLTVTPVKCLKAYQLVARGDVEKIRIISFYTGTVHVEVPQRMVHDALKRMEDTIVMERVNRNNVTCEIVKEAKVLGSAGGVILVTETTTGGIFSSFSLGGERRQR